MSTFSIERADDGRIHISGRFDAGRVDQANEVFDNITGTTVLDFSALRYISSVGLGILVSAQQRLEADGHKLSIVGASDHIRELFRITRFDLLIDIE
jgi:anti-sigma B factor antagonist